MIFTGLDSAGPGFFKANSTTRLNSGDAKYVQVIHTNSGLLGCTFSLGDSDFWPNGGRFQPGCSDDTTGVCSSKRAINLYAESLRDNKFVARKCNSYTLYSNGLCNSAESSYMGGVHPNIK